MMSGSEEPNLFLRAEVGSDENEDWDDSELIKAYDKAVSSAKHKITRKIQKELGLKDQDIQEFLSDTGHSSSTSSKKGKRKKSKKAKGKWVVGSSCRTIYSQDREEYEAVIVKIIDSHWCVVRYVGYENEEEVLLSDLMPSLGKAVVQLQIEAATFEAQENMNDGDGYQDEIPEAQIGEEMLTGRIPTQECHPNTYDPVMNRLPMSFPLPPAPPVPPGMMTKGQTRNQDDVNSMLMSWYLCGYYTGIYERGRQFEN